jgi:multisubunit Na+/H+ antiporter MnhB subunit
MDKKLKNYIAYIDKESSKPTPELIEYHKMMLQQFQHERAIHLEVTLAFALFMIIFFIFFIVLQLNLAPGGELLSYCVGAILIMLVATVLFYVRHYYRLENGVQVLEEITRKLYKRDK